MKKTYSALIFTASVLIITSCNQKEKNNSAKEKDQTEIKIEIPTFKNEKVQEFVNAYEEYINEYTKAADTKDMDVFSSLEKKGSELGKISQEISHELSAKEAKKLGDYMQKKADQLRSISQKLTQ